MTKTLFRYLLLVTAITIFYGCEEIIPKPAQEIIDDDRALDDYVDEWKREQDEKQKANAKQPGSGGKSNTGSRKSVSIG